MPSFTGVNHVALTVTDLDASERFYTDVLGFRRALDVGYGRITIHPATGFTIALLRHQDAMGGEFTELTTGLDHLGFAAASRAELVQWEERLRGAGVPFTPIRDMPLGHHLNFRDPDGIALEFYAPNEVYSAALTDLRSRDVTDEEVLETAQRLLGDDFPTL
ncbi:MAG TPA: VOC family protein [Ornithinibacter sp.]|nr:VOC family protein [Ornithinibacter sp.]